MNEDIEDKTFTVIMIVIIICTAIWVLFIVTSDPSDMEYSQNYVSNDLQLNYPNGRFIGLMCLPLTYETTIWCEGGADGTNYEHIFHDLNITHLLMAKSYWNKEEQSWDIDHRTIGVMENYSEFESVKFNKIHTYVYANMLIDLYEVELKGLKGD